MTRYLIEYILKPNDALECIRNHKRIVLVEEFPYADNLAAAISRCLAFKEQYELSPMGFLIYDNKYQKTSFRVYFNGILCDSYEVDYPYDDIETFIKIGHDIIIPAPDDDYRLITLNI